MAQWIKNLHVMQEMQAVQFQSLGREDITVNFAFRIAFAVSHRFGLFFLFSFVSRFFFFLISSLISSVIHWLFSSIFFNFHAFVFFAVIFLHCAFHSIVFGKKMLYVISILNSLIVILRPCM